MVREMEGVVRLSKYRAMRRRYGGEETRLGRDAEERRIREAVEALSARQSSGNRKS